MQNECLAVSTEGGTGRGWGCTRGSVRQQNLLCWVPQLQSSAPHPYPSPNTQELSWLRDLCSLLPRHAPCLGKMFLSSKISHKSMQQNATTVRSLSKRMENPTLSTWAHTNPHPSDRPHPASPAPGRAEQPQHGRLACRAALGHSHGDSWEMICFFPGQPFPVGFPSSRQPAERAAWTGSQQLCSIPWLLNRAEINAFDTGCEVSVLLPKHQYRLQRETSQLSWSPCSQRLLMHSPCVCGHSQSQNHFSWKRSS